MSLFGTDYNSQHMERKRLGRAFVDAMVLEGYAERGAIIRDDVLIMLGHAAEWGRQTATQGADEQDAPEPEGSRWENLEFDPVHGLGWDETEIEPFENEDKDARL